MEVKLLTTDNTLGATDVDTTPLGETVKQRLLFDAVHMYEARQRVGTASAKTRAHVVGSSRKPWRQKGTGRARAGSLQSPIWRGGGVVHGPKPRGHGYALPRKALREALRSALLSKFRDGEVRLVEELSFETPSTKRLAGLLRDTQAAGSCLVVTSERDRNVYLSCRNIPRVACLPVADLNAYEVLKYRHLLLSTATLQSMLEGF